MTLQRSVMPTSDIKVSTASITYFGLFACLRKDIAHIHSNVQHGGIHSFACLSPRPYISTPEPSTGAPKP